MGRQAKLADQAARQDTDAVDPEQAQSAPGIVVRITGGRCCEPNAVESPAGYSGDCLVMAGGKISNRAAALAVLKINC